MQMNVTLSFKGDCEDAFKFYEQHLGGQPGRSSVTEDRRWNIRFRPTGPTK